MAQTKCNCTNCRRLIDIHQETCPFCGTPNPKTKNSSTNNTPNPITVNRPVQRMQNISIEEMNTYLTETEMEEQIEIPDMENEKTISVSNIDDEEYEEYIPSLNTDTNEENSEDLSSTDYKENITDDFTGTLQSSSKRKKIPWTDEEVKEEPDYSKMYDDSGRYNANFDGYYNDTLPKIAHEIDHVLIGREKSVLKVIFVIVAIIAIILYLILTI
ncbi:MAG: hypothetical protein UHN47_07040 [Lachnospiraceae bacterium]|nr:hypothetical protein [Lachnospiraceae bacterium]